MHSPPVEWTAGIAYLVFIDYIRARGEADGDTLSEVVRDHMDRTPHGRAIFTAGLVAGALVLHRHICK